MLIRFSNSANTLPDVIAALKAQTHQPDVILGIDSHSTDGSASLLREAGANVIPWTAPYEHSAVLNFGIQHLHTDFILILSSHTVLHSPDTLRQMVVCLEQPGAACASLSWDEDPYYSDAITWKELEAKGLRFGSIYSNSMGMIRRQLWETRPFDEEVKAAEDYAWALTQLRSGHSCHRLHLPFGYHRSGNLRDDDFARVTFRFAKQHGLKVAWLGARQSLMTLLKSKTPDREAIKARLWAWLCSWFASGSKSPGWPRLVGQTS